MIGSPPPKDPEAEAQGDGQGDLPTLWQQQLDAAELRALCDDISQLPDGATVVLRASRHQLSEGAQTSPQRVAQLLCDGLIAGAQLRYRYQDQLWCDSLRRTDTGFIVTRMVSPLQIGP